MLLWELERLCSCDLDAEWHCAMDWGGAALPENYGNRIKIRKSMQCLKDLKKYILSFDPLMQAKTIVIIIYFS